MRITKRFTTALLTLIFLAGIVPGGSARAQQGGGITGWLHLTARSLSVSGGQYAEWKYNEDHDYQDGLQLAALSLTGAAAGHSFGIDAAGWGESPSSTLNGTLEKEGSYRLRFGGWNSRYFHTTGSYVDDYDLGASPWSYTRRGRFADLTISAGALPDIRLRYDRYRREGSNLLVWNIEREKHLVPTPVDETSSSFMVATSLPLRPATVDLSLTLHQLDNRYGTALTDTSDGLDGRASRLYDYSHIVHDSGTLPVMKVNLSAPVGPALLRLGYSGSSGTVDKTLEEQETGLDYAGAAVNSSTTVTGSLDRAFSILDGGLSLAVFRGLRADLSLRQTDYGVTGEWDPTGSATEVETAVGSTRLQGRMIWTPLRGVSADLGAATISRTFEENGVESSKTVTTDWIGGLTWASHDRFKVRLSHRVGDIEDPYTRLSPTDRNSSSAAVDLMPLDWLTATFAYRYGTSMRYYSHDRTDQEYFFNTRVSDFRNASAGFRFSRLPLLESLSGHLTMTRGRLEMSIPISAVTPPSPNVFNYRDETWATTWGAVWEVRDGLEAMADGYWFRANGQWPLTRSMMRFGVAVDLKVLTLHADYRSFSLDQVVHDLDDFDASVITIGFSRGF